MSRLQKIMKRNSEGHRYVSNDVHRLHNRQSQRLRSSRLKKSSGHYTWTEFRELCDDYSYACVYCGKVVPNITLTADHKLSLYSKGSDLIQNIVPACLKCNDLKGTITFEHYIAALPKKQRNEVYYRMNMAKWFREHRNE